MTDTDPRVGRALDSAHDELEQALDLAGVRLTRAITIVVTENAEPNAGLGVRDKTADDDAEAVHATVDAIAQVLTTIAQQTGYPLRVIRDVPLGGQG